MFNFILWLKMIFCCCR